MLHAARESIERPHHHDIKLPSPQISHHRLQSRPIVVGSTLTFIPIQDAIPAPGLRIFAKLSFLPIYLESGYSPAFGECGGPSRKPFPSPRRIVTTLVHNAILPEVVPTLGVALFHEVASACPGITPRSNKTKTTQTIQEFFKPAAVR